MLSLTKPDSDNMETTMNTKGGGGGVRGVCSTLGQWPPVEESDVWRVFVASATPKNRRRDILGAYRATYKRSASTS